MGRAVRVIMRLLRCARWTTLPKLNEGRRLCGTGQAGQADNGAVYCGGNSSMSSHCWASIAKSSPSTQPSGAVGAMSAEGTAGGPSH